jgi:GH24 family phage-related lysozyme (muramidase)
VNAVQKLVRGRVKAHYLELHRELRKSVSFHDRLEGEEGESLYAYIDTKGNVTIGMGHNLGALTLSNGMPVGPNVRLVPVNPITREMADQLLDQDIEKVTVALTTSLPWGPSLGEVRWSILLDLGFNMGAARFVRGWPHFLENVRRGEYQSAADKMRASDWYNEVHARRADPLIAMMLTGQA